MQFATFYSMSSVRCDKLLRFSRIDLCNPVVVRAGKCPSALSISAVVYPRYARTKVWAQLSLILDRYPSAPLVKCGLNPEQRLRPNDVGAHGICWQCVTTGYLLALLVGKAHPPPMSELYLSSSRCYNPIHEARCMQTKMYKP